MGWLSEVGWDGEAEVAVLGGWLGEGTSDACDASSESSESYEDPESVMGQVEHRKKTPGC